MATNMRELDLGDGIAVCTSCGSGLGMKICLLTLLSFSEIRDAFMPVSDIVLTALAHSRIENLG